MAPSRGLLQLQRNRTHGPLFRVSGRYHSSWTTSVANPKFRIQSYISSSKDPYLNLSIEHYLLRRSPPDSTVLFLYMNHPSIVIGRNQNPWLEVNLGLLNAARGSQGKETEPPGIGKVDLVRRRSGGGTVFHDEGNVNWSVICPPASFTRDKHAEMVVRALRRLGVDRARVNERHDIVLDQGQRKHAVNEDDTHKTPYAVEDSAGPRPLKVSGSAYKLTRTRALHHATCLLSSPNLNIIPDYLHSPAKPYIKARGVESVSSPVGNIGLDNKAFIDTVQEEFANLNGLSDGDNTAQIVGDELLGVPEVRKGYDELTSPEWTFLQTPQFSLSTQPDGKTKPLDTALTTDLPHMHLLVRYGLITEASISFAAGANSKADQLKNLDLGGQLQGQKLHEIHDWAGVLEKSGLPRGESGASRLSRWLGEMLPALDAR